ncbi:hypothetical protein QG37_03598 [Candidozyma auris]|nr:hypothetical protein QG37_03598 [[Candida] auris]
MAAKREQMRQLVASTKTHRAAFQGQTITKGHPFEAPDIQSPMERDKLRSDQNSVVFLTCLVKKKV